MPAFKVDENLPAEVAALLRQRGYAASTVHDQQLVGSADQTIAEICRREERVLVTLDLDFADIRAYPPENHAGLVVLRLALQDKASVLGVLQRLIPLLDREPLAGRLWVVDETSVRIRGGERETQR